jgi:hypothetical protein
MRFALGIGLQIRVSKAVNMVLEAFGKGEFRVNMHAVKFELFARIQRSGACCAAT